MVLTTFEKKGNQAAFSVPLLVACVVPEKIKIIIKIVKRSKQHMHEDFTRTGLAGVPGAASDIFSAVKDVGANVIMISQVQVIPNCSILAAVGQKIACTPRVSATLFNALAKANINVCAIAHGCTEYKITEVIKREDCIRAHYIFQEPQ
ncbi:bifunctional aspartokinase/homoserine dehydrogenase 1, chloroplastic-like isoform X1 [Pyrus x bretschneideri]|uniref:bifunctional aspartokinase/homoserine dehydrogenase 1, chloroplastic-like isoform X1 n=1 Tax=Pyrus x bretschneideri TaxID=225117 RepID=UPI00202E8459|nr:bifunctional aspartokinase/homoserine dehydrogenase 1, chloroplastic-like isoform X1 [Pyrus x bretschneideri]